MKQAIVVIAEGSESLETITLVNVLRRGGVQVTLASITGQLQVAGTRDIVLVADRHFADVASQSPDLLALPGGEQGAAALAAHEPLVALLKAQRVAHRWTAAICAAPALVLAAHGLLDGKQATGYPAFRDHLLHYVDQPVVVDGHTITAQGPATAIAFGLMCVEKLCGEAVRREVADGLLTT